MFVKFVILQNFANYSYLAYLNLKFLNYQKKISHPIIPSMTDCPWGSSV